jgi:hypothetical protein
MLLLLLQASSFKLSATSIYPRATGRRRSGLYFSGASSSPVNALFIDH